MKWLEVAPRAPHCITGGMQGTPNGWAALAGVSGGGARRWISREGSLPPPDQGGMVGAAAGRDRRSRPHRPFHCV